MVTNTPGWSDMTPLMHAVVQQNHRMVELLLWKGATVDTQRVAACGKNVLAFALSTSLWMMTRVVLTNLLAKSSEKRRTPMSSWSAAP